MWKKKNGHTKPLNGVTLRPCNAAKDPTSLGCLLKKLGAISDEQLAAAVKYKQENCDILIGQILLQLGAIDKVALDAACEEQEILRKEKSERSKAIMEKAVATTKKTLELSDSLDSFNSLITQVSIKLK